MTRRHLLWGVLLFAAAVAVRCFGNTYGIPWLHEPDPESVILAKALSVGRGAENLLEPSRYPHLLVYVLLPIFRVLEDVDPIWIARTVVGVFGALTVVYVVRAGNLAGGPAAGLLAGVLYAFNFLDVQNSHLVKPHVPVTFFTMACVFHCMRLVERSSIRDQLLGGLFAALAIATLHSGALALLAVATALVLSPGGAGVLSWRRYVTRGTVCGGALLGAAIVAGYPNRIADLVHILRGQAEWSALMFPHAESTSENLGLAGMVRVPFAYLEYDPIVFLAAVVGLLAAPWTRPRWFRLALPGIVMTLGVCILFGPMRAFVPRFLLQTMPVLSVVAACASMQALRRAVRPAARAIAIALCVVLVAPMIATTLRLDWLYTRRDTREIAADWICREIPPDATIAAGPYIDFPLPLTLESMREHERAIINLPRWELRALRDLERGVEPTPGVSRYHVVFPFATRWQASTEDRRAYLRARNARYGMSVTFSPLEYDDAGVNVFKGLGTLVFRAAPGAERFFGFNAYMIHWPHLNMWRMQRPGPLIEIFRLDP